MNLLPWQSPDTRSWWMDHSNWWTTLADVRSKYKPYPKKNVCSWQWSTFKLQSTHAHQQIDMFRIRKLLHREYNPNNPLWCPPLGVAWPHSHFTWYPFTPKPNFCPRRWTKQMLREQGQEYPLVFLQKWLESQRTMRSLEYTFLPAQAIPYITSLWNNTEESISEEAYLPHSFPFFFCNMFLRE